MIRRAAIVIFVVVVFVLMLWFTRINPGVIEIDLAFGTVEPSIPMAFAITLFIGWILGLASTGLFMIRLVNERRRLKKSLRIAEAEVSSLRSLPIADAD